MNLLFEIPYDNQDAKQTNLFCEVSEQGFSYVLQDESSLEIKGIGVYVMKNTKDEFAIRLRELFHSNPVFGSNYNKVNISYSFSNSSFLPQGNGENYHHSANALLGGGVVNKLFADTIEDRNIENIYCVPTDIHSTVKSHYPFASFAHSNTYFIKQFLKDDVLKVIFYSNKTVCGLASNGELKLLSSYSYTTKEDVVYYLLNIRNHFKIDGLKLEVCGLIERASSLYDEIHKYFSDISFSEGNTSYAADIKKYPIHYFSHLLSFASCG